MNTSTSRAVWLRAATAVSAGVAAVLLAGCAMGAGQGGPMVQSPQSGENDLLTRPQFSANDGEAARTETLYISVLRRMPNEAETWYRLGNLYANNNRPDPAAAAYNRALLGDNGNSKAYHNLGIIRLRQAYAALLQGQMTVDPTDEAMVKRIDEIVEQLGRVPGLSDQAQAARSNAPERPVTR